MYMYVIPTDVNECETGEALCDINANCTDTEGSYLCQCHPGFSGDGFNCSSEYKHVIFFKSWYISFHSELLHITTYLRT